MEDIAAEADVSQATIYSSVGGEQGLLALILADWGNDPAVLGTLDSVAATGDPRQVICVLSAAACRMREEWGDAARIMMATAPHDAAVAELFADFNVYHRQAMAAVAQRPISVRFEMESTSSITKSSCLTPAMMLYRSVPGPFLPP